MSVLHPGWAVPGSRVFLTGGPFPMPADGPPEVRVGGERARVVEASSHGLRFVVPAAAAGTAVVRVVDGPDGDNPSLEIAQVLTTGVHQVDSPAFDGLGRLYVTQSGGPGTKVSVPIYRVSRAGVREPVAVEVANPTAIVHGPDGAMYLSSRFERTVYRLTTDDQIEVYATDLGVPTGLAFSGDGSLFVGDRSGSILRVTTDRRVETIASLPPSVAAFHLAVGPDDCLYVSAPTLSSRDVVYRVTPDRRVETACAGFGRPQGLAFDSLGRLYVAEALAGSAGLYRVDVRSPHAVPELVLSAPALVGVAFDPDGGVVLSSNDVIWRLDVGLRPYLPAHA